VEGGDVGGGVGGAEGEGGGLSGYQINAPPLTRAVLFVLPDTAYLFILHSKKTKFCFFERGKTSLFLKRDPK